MLSKAVARYVDLHRSLGYQFRQQNILLHNFAAFAEQRGEQFVLTSSAIGWAGQAPSPTQRHSRLATLRRFALAMRAEDPRHEEPPAEIFGRAWAKRRTPYIYSAQEITALVGAAARLSPTESLRPATYSTLFALLAATGLRISEALALELRDLTDDGLMIRTTKFYKSRLVPLHESSRCALEQYLTRRARSGASSPALFISLKGVALCYPTVRVIFRSLARSIGLHRGRGQREPRIHDLRHTFAVRALETCSGDSAAVARHALALSTYLGHAHVSSTYWYLEATPILMDQIARAAEALHRGERT